MRRPGQPAPPPDRYDRVAQAILPAYPYLDEDLLLAGIILQLRQGG